ncbi:MAG: three-Cys-motif partner protein TcmP [Gammaproteobacteria bacterium]
MKSEQTSLQFDEPPVESRGFFVSLPSTLRGMVWTENKAQLIQRYLKLFVYITKHGTYIDGFAGPQRPGHPDSWAAALVLENRPAWMRNFFLCERNHDKIPALIALQQTQPKLKSKRRIEVLEGDFNERLPYILNTGVIDEKQATFCLLDQHTFECKWASVELLARHKKSRKIELFYFLGTSWLGRALRADKDVERVRAWWGRDDWQQLKGKSGQSVAELLAERFQKDLHYQTALAWPIYESATGKRVMFHMIHASDHPEAHKLMYRAYNFAVGIRSSIAAMKQLAFEGI